jgi:hypothetical protein
MRFSSLSLNALSRLGLALLVSLSLASCKTNDRTEQPNNFRMYGLERGHIKFEFSGDLRGTEDMVFDGYGKREVRISKYERLQPGQIIPVFKQTIRDLADMKIVDQFKGQGNHFVDSLYDSLWHLPPSKIPTVQEFMVASLKHLDLNFVAFDTINHYPCEVWMNPRRNLSYHMWRGIILRHEQKTPTGGFVTQVIGIDTNYTMEPALFKVPPQVEMIEGRPLREMPNQ